MQSLVEAVKRSNNSGESPTHSTLESGHFITGHFRQYCGQLFDIDTFALLEVPNDGSNLRVEVPQERCPEK